MLFRDEIVPPTTKTTPPKVRAAAKAYVGARDDRLAAERAEVEARAAIEQAKDDQHALDTKKASAGRPLPEPTLVPRARATLDAAERAARVAREVEAERERDLISAIDAAHATWRIKQQARVDDLVGAYLASLDKLDKLGQELGQEAGVLAGLTRWRAGVGNQPVPNKTRGFTARKLQPADGRVVPADTEVMLGRLRQAARDTATPEPISTTKEPSAQAAVDKLNAQTADRRARLSGRR